MAFAVGDIVTPATSVAGGTAAVNGQIQMRGVVEAVNGGPPITDVDVLWDSGLQEAGILVAALDRIEAPTPAAVALQGQIVRRLLDPSTGISASAAYDAMVLELYKRTSGGDTPTTPDIALTKTLSNGSLFELFVSTLEIVSGR